MGKSLKYGAAVLCLSFALPLMASPLVPPPPKKTGKQHHSRSFPARHNAGRPMHS